jgi:enediyne core biosynthesis thioesterase
MRAYEYVHVVGFEDTNVVGNVYFASYFSWQGRCRELFLRDHAPEVLDELGSGLLLVTTHASCDYHAELHALDEVAVLMRLDDLTPSRIAMSFEYVRRDGGEDETVARGRQEIACMRAGDYGPVPAPVPDALRVALRAYATEEVPT